MNLTNYELLLSVEEVQEECGAAFLKNWWDPVLRNSDKRVFGNSDKPDPFWTVARKMHKVWHGLWEKKGRPYSATVSGGEVDFGLWLAKKADVALLIPAGCPVRYVRKGDGGDDVFGMTLEPTLDVFDGNYTVEQVRVETARGVCIWSALRVEPVKIPLSMLDFAKAQALKEFKCPMLKGGGNGGDD